jgi:methylenetetrahydrofolate dehydrogenase (NADP+)/methenyltetrahydrofolate cyclohydrolase
MGLLNSKSFQELPERTRHMIIDGRKIAEDVYVSLLKERERITRPLRLGIIVGIEDPVIESFLRIKRRAAERLGVEIVRIDLVAPTTMSLIEAVQNISDTVDGVIVQLPLPDTVDVDAVVNAVPKEKDVDANGVHHSPSIAAPVALAIGEILKQSGVVLQEKKVLIVGHGRLVGKPVAAWFTSLSIQPVVVTDRLGLEAHAPSADIIVLGVGEPGLLKSSMITNGVVIIDAGTAELGKKIVGDADPDCAEKASVFTPVPGGVGPVAVAMIFKNLFTLTSN